MSIDLIVVLLLVSLLLQLLLVLQWLLVLQLLLGFHEEHKATIQFSFHKWCLKETKLDTFD